MDEYEKKGLELQNEGKEESDRVTFIKVAITTLAIVVAAVLCAAFWDPEGTYDIKRKADVDKGEAWTIEIRNESVIRLKDESQKGGKFEFRLKGEKAGETTVRIRLLRNDSRLVRQETYHFKVVKGNRIRMKSHSFDKK